MISLSVPSAMYTFSKARQFLKQDFPICFTLAGMVISFNASQPSKHCSPIFATLAGIDIVSNALQSLKQSALSSCLSAPACRFARYAFGKGGSQSAWQQDEIALDSNGRLGLTG